MNSISWYKGLLKNSRKRDTSVSLRQRHQEIEKRAWYITNHWYSDYTKVLWNRNYNKYFFYLSIILFYSTTGIAFSLPDVAFARIHANKVSDVTWLYQSGRFSSFLASMPSLVTPAAGAAWATQLTAQYPYQHRCSLGIGRFDAQNLA